MTTAGEKIIVALDFADPEKALAMVDVLREDVSYFKVGMELFYSVGSQILAAIQAKGCRIFLDLKFHDIPNTVAGAARAAGRYGVSMFNVHAAGGLAMLQQAVAAAQAGAAEAGQPKPLVIGVTVLTSLDQASLETEVGIKRDIGEQVVLWSQLAKSAGLDGVVASPRELPLIRRACGRDFVTVIPGVRPLWAAKNDQKRVMTPGEAVQAGADYLVIGRPITQAPDPREAARLIIKEIEEGWQE